MGAVLKAGKKGPLAVLKTKAEGERFEISVTIEGRHSVLNDIVGDVEALAEYVPKGYTYRDARLSSGSDGLSRIDLRCTRYDEQSDIANAAPIKETYRIDMAEVTYDLEDHEYLKEVRHEILLWLATDEAKRVSGNKYLYKSADGKLKDMPDKGAKFCNAYMAGIKTFNRYYPVIERISTWSIPPGMTKANGKFGLKTPIFSNKIGTFDDPPLKLKGFESSDGNSNWHVSKDTWAEGENKLWTRTQQWTFTPEGSDGDHGWIYRKADQ